VTNSPAIALGLSAPSIHVIVAPGELDQHMRVLTGRWTIDFLAQLTFAAAFVSAAGITLDHGLTTSRSGLADTLNAAAESAERVVGLMDSTKFERSALMTIRSATALDLIISDDRLDPAVASAFRAMGVNLQIVSGVAEAIDPEAD
jgi:DeoR family fructose operon transcriptional repressor